MFSSADLIDALRRRARRSLRPGRAAGEFPPGWAEWFGAMRQHVGAVTGAPAESIVAVMMQREPRLPPRASAALNRWQAFNTLWRQQWHPVSRDQRGLHLFALVVSLLVHVLFAIFLLYIAYVRLTAATQPAAPEGETVIQVEYIGEGTLEDEGGGPAPGEARPDEAQAARAAAPQPTLPGQPASQPPTPQTTPPTPQQPQPQAAAPPLAQPLQVTETPTPDQSFILPPPRIADAHQPRLTVPELSASAPKVKTAEIPTPVTPIQLRPLPRREVAAPQLTPREVQITQREIPAPLPQVRMPELPSQALPTPLLKAGAPSVTERSIPAPPGVTAPATAGTSSASQPAAGTTAATSPTAGGAKPAASSGNRPAATASGSGAKPSPRPGALPSPKRGDDWGASDRNRPGGQAGGLFNADGSPRLAGNPGKVGGGLPPGTITEDFEKIDRHGTWLKRPSTEYTPTAFDKFWIPNESLLEEWVRKNIREVLIPLPGTSKKLRCVVSLLQLGGGCGISDPNLQDVEAGARKPPDVPFKPELQEDQDSLAKPVKP